MTAHPNSLRLGPDAHGHFGIYGGRFVAETLMPLVLELERAYAEAKNDPAFKADCRAAAEHLAGDLRTVGFAAEVRQTVGDETADEIADAQRRQHHHKKYSCND